MGNLTPSDLPAASAAAPFDRPDYGEEPVDTVLAKIERTLSALAAEVTTLRARLGGETSEQSPSPSPAAESALRAELDQIKVQLARIEAAVTPNDARPTAEDKSPRRTG